MSIMNRKEKAKTLDELVKEVIIYMAKNDANTLNEILAAANQKPHVHKYYVVDMVEDYYYSRYELRCSCGKIRFVLSEELQEMKKMELLLVK